MSGVTDSPRWCESCQRWGDHHTDRHDSAALPYRYYVVFSHGAGWGSLEISRSHPVAGMTEVNMMRELIAKQLGIAIANVVVISWTLFAEAAAGGEEKP